ncbi:MAG TPA: MOSC domain-containing protein [Ancylobacter sp.]
MSTQDASTADLFGIEPQAPSIAGQRFEARLSRLLIADGAGFATRDVGRLEVTLEGVPGDRHMGMSRPADSRVPWYPRGTPIRNCRQVTILALDELEEIAQRLGVAEVKPEWIGANMVLEGIPRLTQLPAGTRLHFPSGAALAVEGENMPCRHAGAAVGAFYPEAEGMDVAFIKAAKGLRGLVAWVERAGEIVAGSEVSVRVPAQKLWIR